MASKKLKRLKLEDSLLKKLEKLNIKTCKDLMTKNCVELIRYLGMSYFEVKDLLIKAGVFAAPRPVSALDMWRSNNETACYLPTSLTELDTVLHGGLPAATITELAGPSGCGKTQFCTMLCVLATLPVDLGGLNGDVVFIDTECAFTAERLVEMAQSRLPQKFSTKQCLIELSSKVHVFIESSCKSLLHRLETIEEELISNNVKLLVIDSIASLIRKEFDSHLGQNLIERANLLSKQAAILKYLAEEFKIPVVVTNQITTHYRTRNNNRAATSTEQDNVDDDSDVFGEGHVTAALGNTWSHSVNTRLILQYTTPPYRQILVAKSPVSPFATFVYSIQKSGICLKVGSGAEFEGTDPGLQKIRVRSAIPQDVFY